MVMVGHFITYGGLLPQSAGAARFARSMMVGGLGVDLFFVLSGFLITGILLDSKGATHFFRNFYMRRVLRIFPLYYGALFVTFILAPLLLAEDEALARLTGEQAWYWSYMVNVRTAFWGWPPWHVGHFWSLAVEEQFYVVWPLLVFLCSRRVFFWVCVATIVASPLVRIGLWLGSHPAHVNVFTLATMDGLGFGALLALLARCPGGMERLRRWARWVGSAAGIALIAFLISTGGWDPANVFTRTGGRLLVAVSFASLVVMAASAPPGAVLHRFFASRTMVFFGVYSYGMYVIHQPLILLLRQGGLSLDLFVGFPGARLLGRLTIFTLAMGLTTLLAVASYHFYEQPFLRLKRYFPSGQGDGRKPAPDAVSRLAADEAPGA
jgi:peptidoglycan/LPS O-acetylase OafA/YrhL